MRMVYADIMQVELPFIGTNLDRMYFYRQLGWVGEIFDVLTAYEE